MNNKMFRAAVKYMDGRITKSRWADNYESAHHAYIMSIRIILDSVLLVRSFWIEEKSFESENIHILDELSLVAVLESVLSSKEIVF